MTDRRQIHAVSSAKHSSQLCHNITAAAAAAAVADDDGHD